ncbi:MAG: divalent-cation tolerance protein CutA [Planctomycetes bacterium]|nr:divalent-cation tolerance protein CutA [Planctomycetota bacterium]
MDAAPDAARWVVSTVADETAARALARALVERRLVACVTCLPGATSLYRWEGMVHEDTEVVLFAKTTAARVADLEHAFAELHPYKVPELLVLEPAHVGAPYLAWLRAAVAEER